MRCFIELGTSALSQLGLDGGNVDVSDKLKNANATLGSQRPRTAGRVTDDESSVLQTAKGLAYAAGLRHPKALEHARHIAGREPAVAFLCPDEMAQGQNAVVRGGQALDRRVRNPAGMALALARQALGELPRRLEAGVVHLDLTTAPLATHPHAIAVQRSDVLSEVRRVENALVVHDTLNLINLRPLVVDPCGLPRGDDEPGHLLRRRRFRRRESAALNDQMHAVIVYIKDSSRYVRVDTQAVGDCRDRPAASTAWAPAAATAFGRFAAARPRPAPAPGPGRPRR